jgi:hypothetical protein
VDEVLPNEPASGNFAGKGSVPGAAKYANPSYKRGGKVTGKMSGAEHVSVEAASTIWRGDGRTRTNGRNAGKKTGLRRQF